jgi:hypothetical protein
VEALDVDGTPISLFTTVKAQFMPDGQVHKKQTQSVLGRMETAFVFDRQTSAADKNATELKIELQFLGHYREPAFRFAYPVRHLLPILLDHMLLVSRCAHTGPCSMNSD